jgi:hypothetical protein
LTGNGNDKPTGRGNNNPSNKLTTTVNRNGSELSHQHLALINIIIFRITIFIENDWQSGNPTINENNNGKAASHNNNDNKQ